MSHPAVANAATLADASASARSRYHTARASLIDTMRRKAPEEVISVAAHHCDLAFADSEAAHRATLGQRTMVLA